MMALGVRNESVFGWNFAFSFLALPIQGLILYYFWKKGMGAREIQGFRTATLVYYFLFQNMLMSAFEPAMMITWEVSRDISSGAIVGWLFRPVSYPLLKYAQKTGYFLLRLSFLLAVMAALAAAFGDAFSWKSVLGAWAASLASFTLLFEIQMILGLLAFRLRYVIMLRDAVMDILWILGGMILPIDFFPAALRHVVQYTVIPFVHYTPAKILTAPEGLSTPQVIAGYAVRILLYAWIIHMIWKMDSTKADQGA